MSIIRKPKGSQFDLFDLYTVKGVFKNYELGEVYSIESLIIDDRTIINLTDRSNTSKKVVVNCETGSYFLKQVPWYCNDVYQLVFSLEFQNYLYISGFPTPRPIRAKSGLLFAEYQREKFEIFTMLTGSSFSYNIKECENSAEALAKLHLLSEKWKFPETAPKISLLQIVEEHILLAKELAKERNDYETNHRLFEELRLHSMRTFNIECHKTIPVHGDFIPWNIGYKDGEVCAIYDFDNASNDSRLHDIGEAIVGFFALEYAGDNASLKRTESNSNIESENILGFLNSYERILPLTKSEKAVLPEYIAGAWWEALLLGYIKGEIPIEALKVLTTLTEISRRSCNGAI